ncbi:hypothetical protein DPX16_22717 [Anabarilius grahami]|uniref:Uncharacterized protein n=1 Tax=Anabarilius grahami TaxID=495550 RepID=A0A3N0Z9F6_ANAGA|nr:hypothetical protein DPX16_22717 [Anabarilius grahami]
MPAHVQGIRQASINIWICAQLNHQTSGTLLEKNYAKLYKPEESSASTVSDQCKSWISSGRSVCPVRVSVSSAGQCVQCGSDPGRSVCPVWVSVSSAGQCVQCRSVCPVRVRPRQVSVSSAGQCVQCGSDPGRSVCPVQVSVSSAGQCVQCGSDPNGSVWVSVSSAGQCVECRSVCPVQVSVSSAGQTPAGQCGSVCPVRVSVSSAGQTPAGQCGSVCPVRVRPQRVSVDQCVQCGSDPSGSVWVSVSSAGQCGSVCPVRVSVSSAGQCVQCGSDCPVRVSVGQCVQCGSDSSGSACPVRVRLQRVSVSSAGQIIRDAALRRLMQLFCSLLPSALRPASRRRYRLTQTRTAGDSAEQSLVRMRGALGSVRHHVSDLLRADGALRNHTSDRRSGSSLWTPAELQLMLLLQERQTNSDYFLNDKHYECFLGFTAVYSTASSSHPTFLLTGLCSHCFRLLVSSEPPEIKSNSSSVLLQKSV